MSKNTNHYKHQLRYFGHEFKSMSEYRLAPWQKSYIERIKKYMLGNSYKGKTLIDVATGSGYVAIEMAKLGLNVVATDLSPEAIENIRKFKKQFKLNNIKLYVCYAEDIPIKDKSVDYIVANAILEHVPNEGAAVSEWKRMLKKKGKIFLTVPLKLVYVWPLFWIPNIIHDRNIGHLRRYDLEILKKLFGFRLLKVFYTGHFIKTAGVLISILLKTEIFTERLEKIDDKKTNISYGANNISVILENKV